MDEPGTEPERDPRATGLARTNRGQRVEWEDESTRREGAERPEGSRTERSLLILRRCSRLVPGSAGGCLLSSTIQERSPTIPDEKGEGDLEAESQGVEMQTINQQMPQNMYLALHIYYSNTRHEYRDIHFNIRNN